MLLEDDHEWRVDTDLEGGGRGGLMVISQYSYQETEKNHEHTVRVRDIQG
jgi:hypothetical protein